MFVPYFKRDNELTERLRKFAQTLDEAPKLDLLKLIRDYEHATFPEWSDKAEFTADAFERMVNDFGFADDEVAAELAQEKELENVTCDDVVNDVVDYVADKFAKEHPTNQQSFMRLCMKFIKKMSEKKYWDGRNEASVKTAQKIMEAFGDEPIGLPCV